ncbi:hypothetical protein SF83666_b50880 (plasmid) [Sinorhizobium fredii CCBAU 83666]|nr:hypothetical protein SF83666_b50880 [Sinorhizobium fredii CCBAU 83666]
MRSRDGFLPHRQGPATAPPPGFFASVVVAQIKLVNTTEPRFSCQW